MISLKQIHYALAVGKTLHFRKAADLCSVSQSALSAAIIELEKQFGAPIFERDNKKVIITPIGELFLEKARAIKIQLDDLSQLGQVSKAPLSMPMSLGAIPTIGPYLLPRVLPVVRSRYPEFRMQILEDQTHVLLDMVRSGEIDTAVIALPYDTTGLLTFEFWHEEFFWLTHRSARYAEQRSITSAELQQTGLMLLKDGHCLKDHVLSACRLKPSEQETAFSSTSLTTLVQMVAGQMGTTLVPEMALEQLLAGSQELKALRLDEPGPHRRIAFVVRPGYPRVADVELLTALFKEILRENPGFN